MIIYYLQCVDIMYPGCVNIYYQECVNILHVSCVSRCLTIPMALFSEKVDKDIKARLAARLLALKNNTKNTKAQKLV